MGDDRRGALFAKFIVTQFPKANIIFDIAGGKGQVARSLANKNKIVYVMDAKPRLDGANHPNINYYSGFFYYEQENSLSNLKPDLITGMHPDEATCEIVRYANKHRIPFAIVPCRLKGRDNVNIKNFTEWCKKLKSLAPNHWVQEYRLKMNKILPRNRRAVPDERQINSIKIFYKRYFL